MWVYGSLIAAASLPSPHSPLLLLLSVVFSQPPFLLSVLLSTCRALTVNQQATLCLLPLTVWKTLSWPLIGWQLSVAENYGPAHITETVCVPGCVREWDKYYEEAGLSGRWWFFSCCKLHTSFSCCSFLFFLPLVPHKDDSMWDSVCIFEPVGGWVKWKTIKKKKSKPINLHHTASLLVTHVHNTWRKIQL